MKDLKSQRGVVLGRIVFLGPAGYSDPQYVIKPTTGSAFGICPDEVFWVEGQDSNPFIDQDTIEEWIQLDDISKTINTPR